MDTPYDLVLFDVEGTLTTTLSGKTFRAAPDDWCLLPGRAEQLAALRAGGARLALCTNQGGAAFAYFEAEDMDRELALLAEQVGAERVYVCYHHPDGFRTAWGVACDCRKPKPGLVLRALADFAMAPRQVLLVGDRAEDEGAAAAAGVAFCWAAEYFPAVPGAPAALDPQPVAPPARAPRPFPDLV